MLLLSEPKAPGGYSFATGEVGTFLDVVDAAQENTRLAWNSNSYKVALEDAYDRRIAAVKEATGQTLENPMRALASADDFRQMASRWRAGGHPVQHYDLLAEQFQRTLARIAESNPDKAGLIRAHVPVIEDAHDLAKASEARLSDVMSRTGGLTGFAGNLAGGFAGSLEDPLTIPTMLIGFSGSASKSLLWNALRAAASNAAGQAVVEPFIQQWRAEAGLEAGLVPGLKDIAFAGAIGGGLDFTVRGLVRGGKYVTGANMPTPPELPRGATIEEAIARLPDDNPIKAAAKGDDAALVVAAQQIEGHLTTAERGALRSLEDDLNLGRADGAKIKIDAGEDLAAIAQAIRHAEDPHLEPMPVHEPVAKVEPVAIDPKDEVAVRLSEGRGTAIETATAFRARPELAAAVPIEGKARTAKSLARLDEPAFDMVRRGAVKESWGALVGDLVADPAEHVPVLERLAEQRPERLADARRIIAEETVKPAKPRAIAEALGGGEAMPVETTLQRVAHAIQSGTVPAKRAREALKRRMATIADDAGPEPAPRGLDEPAGPEAKAEVEAKLKQVKSRLGKGLDQITKETKGGQAAVDRVAGRGGKPKFSLSPLDMSPEARKARAEAMGFDTSKVWYHGTQSVFGAFDIEKSGGAVHFAEHPDLPAYYAYGGSALAGEGKQVLVGGPDWAKVKTLEQAVVRAYEEAQKTGDWTAWKKAKPLAEDARREAASRSSVDKLLAGGSIIPAYVRMKNPLEITPRGEDYNNVKAIKEAIATAKANGNDAIIVNHQSGGKQLVMLDPSNIRSINAAFDPGLDGRNGLLFALSPAAAAAMPDIRAKLHEAAALLPKAVRIRLYDTLTFGQLPERIRALAPAGVEEKTIAGLWDAEEMVIHLSLSTGDPLKTLRHEQVHMMRALGLLTDDDYRRLVRHAERTDARKTFKIDATYGETIKAQYADKAAREAVLVEETVAHLVAERLAGKPIGGGLDKILKPIRDFLARIRDALGLKGLRTVEDVFGLIERGGDFAIAPPSDTKPRFMFGGENAATADRNALATAKQMQMDGKPREDIWRKTGWFQGVDGKWRFEIDDRHAAVLTNPMVALANKTAHAVPIGEDVLHFDYLKAYPEARSLMTQAVSGKLFGKQVDAVYYDRRGIAYNAKSDNSLGHVLHELQHDAQSREGFARGGNAKMVPKALIDRERARLLQQSDGGGGWTSVGTVASDVGDEQIAHNVYRRLAGEVEARTVDRRKGMTAAERKSRAPWLDYDVPEDQQLMSVSNDVMFSISPDDAEAALGVRLGDAELRDKVAGAARKLSGNVDMQAAWIAGMGLEQGDAEEIVKLYTGFLKDFSKIMDASTAKRLAREEVAKLLETEALHRKRVALLQLEATTRVREALSTHKNARGEVDPAQAMIGHLEHYGMEGTPIESSVEGRRKAILGQAHARLEEMIWAFRKTGVTGRRMNVAKMENVVRELFDGGSGDAAAKAFADAWTEVSENLRQRFNRAGGAVGKLEKWGLPQVHDARALRKRGLAQWKADTLALLDPAKMRHPISGQPMTTAQVAESLDVVYRRIVTDGLVDAPAGAGGGRGALHKQHAEHRFLVFKNADAWMKYQKLYGTGGAEGIFAAMMNHVNLMSRDIAAMEVLGPNPNMTFEAMVSFVQTQGGRAIGREPALFPTRSPKGLPWDPKVYMDSSIWRARGMWEQINGSANTPANGVLANTIAAIRNITFATALGSAAISSLTDLGRQQIHRRFAGVYRSAHSGRDMRGVASPFVVLGDVVQQFKGVNRREAIRAGLIMESAVHVLHENARYVGSINGPVKAQVFADRMLTWALLTPWTQANRHVFGLSIMAEVADNVGKRFADLDPGLQRLFGRYGMGAAEWDAIRQFTPSVMGDADAFVRGRQPGADAFPKNPTPATIRDAGKLMAGSQAGEALDPIRYLKATDIADERLAERYLEMILQETERAVPSGTVANKAFWVGGTRPGSWGGEIMRSISMLKSYGTIVLMQDWGRVASEVGQGRPLNGARFMGSIVITSTLLGGLVMQLKSLSRGEDPRPMDEPEFWGAAMMQGGGMGIYGDYLFGSVNRFGGGFAGSLAGPVTSRASNLWNLTGGNLIQFASDEPTNFGRESVSFARMNLSMPFYLRLAYERVLLDELQKVADPEAYQAFRRKASKLKSQFKTGYWWAPGETGPRRAPDLGNLAP